MYIILVAGIVAFYFFNKEKMAFGEWVRQLHMGTSKNTSRASRASNLSLIYSLFLVNFCL